MQSLVCTINGFMYKELILIYLYLGFGFGVSKGEVINIENNVDKFLINNI